MSQHDHDEAAEQPTNPVLTRLYNEREQQEAFIRETMERATADNRDLVEAETRNMESATERISKIDEQIKPIEAFESRAAAHRKSQTRFTPVDARPTGHRDDRGDDNGERSGYSMGARVKVKSREVSYRSAGEFIADQLLAEGNPKATGRAYAEPDHGAQQRVNAYIEQRAVAHQTTTDTPGLLPENIVGDIHNDIDGSRPFLTTIGVKAGGMSPGKKFYRPIVAQHTTAGKQTAEKTELPSRKLIINQVEFNKETFGGALNVSRQDIDWTSPSAWDAILADLQASYGEFTEDYAAAAFGTLVTQETELVTDDVDGWITALYDAAQKVVTANGTKRASARRVPNHVWTSVDMAGKLGAMLDIHRASNYSDRAGTGSPAAFGGRILDFDRTMVPGLPAGTMIVGRTNLVEAWEERIGLLQAIQPSVLGIEIAYGGYLAFGALDATGFVKIVNDTP